MNDASDALTALTHAKGRLEKVVPEVLAVMNHRPRRAAVREQVEVLVQDLSTDLGSRPTPTAAPSEEGSP
jgi:hypothetical protein